MADSGVTRGSSTFSLSLVQVTHPSSAQTGSITLLNDVQILLRVVGSHVNHPRVKFSKYQLPQLLGGRQLRPGALS